MCYKFKGTIKLKLFIFTAMVISAVSCAKPTTHEHIHSTVSVVKEIIPPISNVHIKAPVLGKIPPTAAITATTTAKHVHSKPKYGFKYLGILPFTQEEFDGESTEIARKMLYNIFLATSVDVLPLDTVNQKLKKLGVDRESVKNIDYHVLADSLGVDTLLYGNISKNTGIAGTKKLALYLNLRIVDAQSGKVVWKNNSIRGKAHGSQYFSEDEISRYLPSGSKRYITLVQRVYACIAGLENNLPKQIKPSEKPKISFMMHNSPSAVRKLGDTVNVLLKGTPGCEGQFSIGSSFTEIPLKEVKKGVYSGRYVVHSGDDILFSRISAVLSNDSEHGVLYYDVMGPVSFDTIPPAVPENFSFSVKGTAVSLDWNKDTKPGIGGYRVLRSSSEFATYKNIAEVVSPSYKDKGLTYFSTYCYKVVSVDKAGNESAPTQYNCIMPVPPGPTYVDGELIGENTWYRKSSPYIIPKEFVVQEGASLIIEPGVEVMAHDKASLQVRGILYAKGTEDKPIYFSSRPNKDKPNAKWKGVIFEQGSEGSIIKHCIFKGAYHGVFINSSSPTFDNCTFESNYFGIKISGDASPQIEMCNIIKNTKTGIYVTNKAKPIISECNISENLGNGVTMETSSPRITGCRISNNQSSGIRITFSTPNITNNNIVENGVWNILKTHPITQVLPLMNNWWGSSDCLKILEKMSGRVDFSSILDAPAPKGKPLSLDIPQGKLHGEIKKNTYILKTFSPFIIEKSLYITQNAKFVVSDGVVFKFEPDTAIVLKRGTVVAEGRPGSEIVFTSNTAQHKPGDYLSGVILSSIKGLSNQSVFKYCRFEYAQSGIIINSGSPIISYSTFSNNSQAGIKIFSDSSPQILHSVISNNAGLGGIYCLGKAKPRIAQNNIMDNSWGIQSFAKNYINARNNWWGTSSPPSNLFIGNIDYNPWLASEVVRKKLPR